MSVPRWLARVTPETMNHEPFPLHDILRDSLYYPASGLDGDPVKRLAGCVHSFVYVDIDLDRTELERELERREFRDYEGFRGYGIVDRREVTREGLFRYRRPPRAVREVLARQLGEKWYRELPPRGEASFFCDWFVFERQARFGRDYGPSRFSFLVIRAEAVRTFLKLYMAESIAPEAVAVIQSGWPEMFEDPGGLFPQCVLANPAGRPKILLLGGYGPPDPDGALPWPGYRPPCVHEWATIRRKEHVDANAMCSDVVDDHAFEEYEIEPPRRVRSHMNVWLRKS